MPNYILISSYKTYKYLLLINIISYSTIKSIPYTYYYHTKQCYLVGKQSSCYLVCIHTCKYYNPTNMVAGSQAEWVAQAGTDGRMFYSEKGRHLPYTCSSLEAGEPPSGLEYKPLGEPYSKPVKPSSIYILQLLPKQIKQLTSY